MKWNACSCSACVCIVLDGIHHHQYEKKNFHHLIEWLKRNEKKRDFYSHFFFFLTENINKFLIGWTRINLLKFVWKYFSRNDNVHHGNETTRFQLMIYFDIDMHHYSPSKTSQVFRYHLNFFKTINLHPSKKIKNISSCFFFCCQFISMQNIFRVLNIK